MGVVLLGALAGCRGKDAAPAAPPQPSAPATGKLSASASEPGTPTSPPATSSKPLGGHEWNFDGDAPGASPAGFSFGRTGSGHEGKWTVRAESAAPSGSNVLAQVDADPTDDRFPIAFTSESFAPDVDVSVKCKPISGSVDQACGLVLRLADLNNYYLTRANALESNVRLYVVKDGHRQQLASWSATVTAGAWHDYRVVARGDHFEVFWDGSKVLDIKDTTFNGGGRVGVWTKADSVTHFDNLTVKPLLGEPK